MNTPLFCRIRVVLTVVVCLLKHDSLSVTKMVHRRVHLLSSVCSLHSEKVFWGKFYSKKMIFITGDLRHIYVICRQNLFVKTQLLHATFHKIIASTIGLFPFSQLWQRISLSLRSFVRRLISSNGDIGGSGRVL